MGLFRYFYLGSIESSHGLFSSRILTFNNITEVYCFSHMKLFRLNSTVFIRNQTDSDNYRLLQNPNLPPIYSDHPEVVEIFLFVHPIRQAANTVEALLVKVNEMQQRRPGWRVYPPSYPFAKALQRTNGQVRHDRGGVTAGFFFQSQRELASTMKGMANVYKPAPRKNRGAKEEENFHELEPTDTRGAYAEEEEIAMDKNSPSSRQKRLRYKTWKVLHRLQGFETRFAFKAAIVTSLVSIPAWLDQSREWWNRYESWWAVMMVWMMMHPRRVPKHGRH